MSTSQNNALPIMIIGGGIGGLCAALALSRKGYPVHLFEQAEEFRPVGAGLQVGPNAFRIFDALGLTDAISRVATFPEALVVMDAVSGDEVTNIPVGEPFRTRFGYPYGLMHRADLHAVLLAACRDSSLIILSTDQKLNDFEDRGDSVIVSMESGDRYEGAALIGADGLWSTVRSKIVGDGKPRVAGHIAYRAIIPTAKVPQVNQRNAMVLWAGPKVHLVHWPMRGGEFYNLTAVFHSDRYEEGWDSYGSPDELHERFACTRPEVRGILERIEDWRMFVLCDREPIKEWSRGRVTLLGDAAHPMLQYLAQGACMAMEDAMCLASQVGKADGDYAQAFIDYQESRYLRTARTQLTARLYGEVYHASGATRDLRNAFLQSRSPDQTLEGMAWLYDTREYSAL